MTEFQAAPAVTARTRRFARRLGRGAFVAAVATGVTLAGTPAFAGSADDWDIVAHRGGLINAPEHTLAAFANMLRLKVDAVEVDVMMSRDDVPMVFHDDALERTTNCRGLLENKTKDQLKQCDAGTWFDPKTLRFENQRIPTLNETLKYLEGNAPKDFKIFLHLKTTSKKDAKKIANVVQRYDNEDKVIPISNSKTMLSYIKKEGLKRQGLVSRSPRLWDTGYKFLIPYELSMNSSLIKRAHQRGQRVMPVQSHPYTLLQLDAFDVDAVLANDLVAALLLAGRLTGVTTQSSREYEGAKEVRKMNERAGDAPTSGPSRSTGPMDF